MTLSLISAMLHKKQISLLVDGLKCATNVTKCTGFITFAHPHYYTIQLLLIKDINDMIMLNITVKSNSQ